MSRPHGSAMAGLLLLLAGAASAGRLEGTIAAREGANGAERTHPEHTVVWVDTIPAKVEQNLARGPKTGWFGWFGKRQPPPTPVLLQSKLRFEPPVVAVVAGTPLEVRNVDGVWHGMFSVSPAHTFDLGKRPPGHTDTLRFASPGVVPVRCDIHPDMSANVVVTPNHAHALADTSGHWRLPELPEGRYVLRAWSPTRGELRREVTVPRRGSAELELKW